MNHHLICHKHHWEVSVRFLKRFAALFGGRTSDSEVSSDAIDYIHFPHADKSPEDFMNFCVDRALALYDAGNLKGAESSFFSDVKKHPATAYIGTGPMAEFDLVVVLDGQNKGREAFEEAMRGFALER